MVVTNKYKQYNITDPIYRAHLSLFIGDKESIKKHLISVGVPGNKIGNIATGKFLFNEDQCIIILPKYNLYTLVHELIHYAFAVMYGRGIPINYENDETITYYVEMTLKNVLEKIKNH